MFAKAHAIGKAAAFVEGECFRHSSQLVAGGSCLINSSNEFTAKAESVN
jgi:hypothetical protein